MPLKSEKLVEIRIKDFALSLGFDACGISNARYLEEEKEALDSWLANGFHAAMDYMNRNQEMRLNPSLIHEGTLSVISVICNYYPENKQDINTFQISKYAYGSDYHGIIKDKLKQLVGFIKQEFPASNSRVFVDSAPILDKAWAKNAGLGWIGKNSLLLNKKLGSYFFIGEVLVDVALKADEPSVKSYCGTCTRCIDACPTQAIVAPYVVDSNKCISYHTIESKTEIPTEVSDKMENWIFGCDICQDVCPWNAKLDVTTLEEFSTKADLIQLSKKEWRLLNEEEFLAITEKSPLQRAGFQRISSLIQSERKS